MKTRFWADCYKKLRLPYLILASLSCFILLFASCKSSSVSADNEIIAYSIRLSDEKMKAGLPWQAVDIYERAYGEVKDYRLIYNEAVVFAKMGYYPEAVWFLESALKDFPENKDVFLPALASFYALNGQNKEAKSTYETYLDDHKNDKITETEYMKFCYKNSYMGEAYNAAIHLWDQKEYNKDVVDVLYAIDKKQWHVMKQLFPDKEPEDTPEEQEKP